MLRYMLRQILLATLLLAFQFIAESSEAHGSEGSKMRGQTKGSAFATLSATQATEDETLTGLDVSKRQWTRRAGAGSIQDERSPLHHWHWLTDQEPYDAGWALYIDNDLFTLRKRDQDYTGGLSVTLAGRRAIEYGISLDPVRAAITEQLGILPKPSSALTELHGIEAGFTIFTPKSIDQPDKQLGDRPFASLLYLANTQELIDSANDTAWVSTFTLGVLGADWVNSIQTELHAALGSDRPSGWDQQISDGGELTFKYSIGKQQLIAYHYGEQNFELSSTSQLSVGYLTEATFGLAGRYGSFQTPWYSFRPQFNDYSEKSTSLAGLAEHRSEVYVWGGFSAHLRGYNVFLQGQFKDSPVTFSSNELNRLVWDAWVGITHQSESGWRFSYLLRGQSSEVKQGPADRSVLWGGMIISASY